MGKNYDNWGRLVEAVERREQFRRLSLADSISSCSPRSSFDSQYSTSSTFTSISLQQQPADFSFRSTTSYPSKQSGTNKVLATTRNLVWKGLSIFRGFSLKKEKEKEKAKREAEALYGNGIGQMENYQLVFQNVRRRAEITRLRELHTLKGHIEALAKAKGIDLDSIHHYYTV